MPASPGVKPRGSSAKAICVALMMVCASLALVATNVSTAEAAGGCVGTSGTKCLLQTNESLYKGQSLVNGVNNDFTLAMQWDGNFVLYAGNRALWQSGTAGRGGVRVTMQLDGNLVMYNAANQPLWQTHTYGNSFSHLSMQPDGNAVVYSITGTPLWATNTWWPYPYWIASIKLCQHVFRLDSPSRAWDPKAQFEVATSYTFGFWGGHCVYQVTNQIGVDINTLDVIGLSNYYDIGWHWDVLSAAGAGAAGCNPTGLYWAPELLPYRAVMTAWCGAVAAAGYVIT